MQTGNLIERKNTRMRCCRLVVVAKRARMLKLKLKFLTMPVTVGMRIHVVSCELHRDKPGAVQLELDP